MKKNFGKKTILAPLPVLIVATYDENGTPDAMNAAWGGQCSAHHVALNLAIGHKTTRNLLQKKAFTLIHRHAPTVYWAKRSVRLSKTERSCYEVMDQQ